MRLINAYLSKDWTLILVGFTTSVLAIFEEGFTRTQILILDDNVDKIIILIEWIKEQTCKFISNTTGRNQSH